MRSSKKVPKTVRERTTRLLKMAGSLASQEILKRFQKTQSSITPLLNLPQIHLLVKELGHLKGAAMKLGQMLALEARDYFPEEVCVILDQLQSNASFLEFPVIESILKTELQEKYQDFSEISEEPIAAASIGQVHFSKLQSGEELAIKIQYPGIADSIDSDIKILSKILKAASFLMRKQVDLTPLIQEFSQILIQESNYLKEANYSENYREKAKVLPEIIIPAIYNQYSTQKILTMEFKRGQKFSQWISTQEATLENRSFYGKLILDLYTREFCDWGLVQTDPNLGNFLFCSKNRTLVLLDFGATKEYDLDFRRNYSKLITATLEKNSKKILKLGEQMRLIHPQESVETKNIFKELLLESMKPIAQKEYDFSESSYPEKMRTITRNLVKSLRFSAPPENLIFLHRKLSGVFYILRGLKIKLQLKSYTERFEALDSLKSF